MIALDGRAIKADPESSREVSQKREGRQRYSYSEGDRRVDAG
jgi:hypothetical protein